MVSSLLGQRKAIMNWSRDELIDRYLRLLDENQDLKKQCRQYEDQVKRLMTKLMRTEEKNKCTTTFSARSVGACGEDGRAAASLSAGVKGMNDSDVTELIRRQQEQITEQQRSIQLLKDRLVYSRQTSVSMCTNIPGRSTCIRALSGSHATRRDKTLRTNSAKSAVHTQRLLRKTQTYADKLENDVRLLTERNMHLMQSLAVQHQQADGKDEEIYELKIQLEKLKEENQSRYDLSFKKGNKEISLGSEICSTEDYPGADEESRDPRDAVLECYKMQLSELQDECERLNELLVAERHSLHLCNRQKDELVDTLKHYQSDDEQIKARIDFLCANRSTELEIRIDELQSENHLVRKTYENVIASMDHEKSLANKSQASQIEFLSKQVQQLQLLLQTEHSRCVHLSQYFDTHLKQISNSFVSPLISHPPTSSDHCKETSLHSSQPDEVNSIPHTSPPRTNQPTSPLYDVKHVQTDDDTNDSRAYQSESLKARYIECIQQLEESRDMLQLQMNITNKLKLEKTDLDSCLQNVKKEFLKTEAEMERKLAKYSLLLKKKTKFCSANNSFSGTTPAQPAILSSIPSLTGKIVTLVFKIKHLHLLPEAFTLLNTKFIYFKWSWFHSDKYFYSDKIFCDKLNLDVSSQGLFKGQFSKDFQWYIINCTVNVSLYLLEDAEFLSPTDTKQSVHDGKLLCSACVTCPELLHASNYQFGSNFNIPDYGSVEYHFALTNANKPIVQPENQDSVEINPDFLSVSKSCEIDFSLLNIPDKDISGEQSCPNLVTKSSQSHYSVDNRSLDLVSPILDEVCAAQSLTPSNSCDAIEQDIAVRKDHVHFSGVSNADDYSVSDNSGSFRFDKLLMSCNAANFNSPHCQCSPEEPNHIQITVCEITLSSRCSLLSQRPDTRAGSHEAVFVEVHCLDVSPACLETPTSHVRLPEFQSQDTSQISISVNYTHKVCVSRCFAPQRHALLIRQLRQRGSLCVKFQVLLEPPDISTSTSSLECSDIGKARYHVSQSELARGAITQLDLLSVDGVKVGHIQVSVFCLFQS